MDNLHELVGLKLGGYYGGGGFGYQEVENRHDMEVAKFKGDTHEQARQRALDWIETIDAPSAYREASKVKELTKTEATNAAQ